MLLDSVLIDDLKKPLESELVVESESIFEDSNHQLLEGWDTLGWAAVTTSRDHALMLSGLWGMRLYLLLVVWESEEAAI